MGVLLLQKRSGYYANHLGKIENAIKYVKTQILKNLKTKKKSIEYWYEDFDQILGKYYYLVHCVIRTIFWLTYTSIFTKNPIIGQFRRNREWLQETIHYLTIIK